MAINNTPNIIITPLNKFPIAPGKFLEAYINTKHNNKKPTKDILA